ncbi:MAG: hypothetical protein IT457_15805 [Planctomycetes bacterium]|nr:hypothetical protein [Planctomycetota bacterium]
MALPTPLRIAVAILVAVLAGTAAPRAQDPRSDDAATDPHAWEREALAREWQAIVEGMASGQRRAFETLGTAERAREVRRLLDEQRAREDAAFLDGLPDELRDAYAATPREEQPARLLQLKVGQKLERTLLDAEALGVVDAAQAAAARALGSPAHQAQRILELQKALFLAANEALFARLPASTRAEVMALPPRAFFRHGVVAGVRLRARFSAQGFHALRNAGPAAIDAFLGSLAAGTLSLEQRGLLSTAALESATSTDAATRRRFAEELRSGFFRELPPRGARAPVGPTESGSRLPPEQFARLTREEQAEYLRMPPAAQRNFVRRRFPELEFAAAGGNARMHLSTREFLDGFAKLDEAERAALLDEPLQRAVAGVVRERQGEDAGDSATPRPLDVDAVLQRLGPIERAQFERLPERARRAWLRSRFPDGLPPQRR